MKAKSLMGVLLYLAGIGSLSAELYGTVQGEGEFPGVYRYLSDGTPELVVASPYPLGIDWSAYNRIPRLYFTEFTGSKLWRVNPDGSELVLEATFPKPPYAIDVHPFLGTYHIGGTGAPAGLGVYEGVVGNSQRNLLSSDGGRIDGQ